MSKKHYHKDECCCCCQPCCPQNNNYNNGGCCGNPFSGINSCVAPIIFLLIACGSGLLCSGSSYFIILAMWRLRKFLWWKWKQRKLLLHKQLKLLL